MTDRDHFAAAALTSLLNTHAVYHKEPPAVATMAYAMADAMLRERAKTNHDAAPAARASLPTADHAVCRGRESGCGTGGQPAIDRLREWERHGSGRWGLGAAGDVTMIERRLAMLEAVHYAAPAARAPEPEPEPAARRRPAGGTGDTDHGAAPAARASVGRPRTDNADLPICAGTGDTPDSPQPIACSVFDRSQPIAKPTPVHTPPAHATPSVGSVPRDGTEPVAWGVANGKGLLATSISRIDAVDMQSDYACDTEVVPLYRKPTLTDAEREAVETCIADDEAMTHDSRAATLRGLLERLGGAK